MVYSITYTLICTLYTIYMLHETRIQVHPSILVQMHAAVWRADSLAVHSGSVGTLLFTAIGISTALISLHGAFRVPDDLFLDESEVGSASPIPVPQRCARRRTWCMPVSGVSVPLSTVIRPPIWSVVLLSPRVSNGPKP